MPPLKRRHGLRRCRYHDGRDGTLGRLGGILEAYNLFNHENFGNYEVRESNANYGQPIPILSLVSAAHAALGVQGDVLNLWDVGRALSGSPREPNRVRATTIRNAT
jgi:hypothetical protein